MFGETNPTPRKTIGLILVPDFAMMSAAIEPLRAANLMGGTALYRAIFPSTEANGRNAGCNCSIQARRWRSAKGRQ